MIDAEWRIYSSVNLMAIICSDNSLSSARHQPLSDLMLASFTLVNWKKILWNKKQNKTKKS